MASSTGEAAPGKAVARMGDQAARGNRWVLALGVRGVAGGVAHAVVAASISWVVQARDGLGDLPAAAIVVVALAVAPPWPTEPVDPFVLSDFLVTAVWFSVGPACWAAWFLYRLTGEWPR